MGALQTFHWGALYPDMVKRIAPFCSSAKCSRHNCVFLEGVRAALTCDAAYNGGWYRSRPRKACGRWRASMPAGDRPSIANGSTSSVWGYSSLEDFLVAYWENFFLPKDVNNLLTMLWTWQHGDISDNELYRADFKKALGAIKAKAYVMREQTALYFAPEDGQFESPTCRMRNFCPSRRFGAISAGGPGTNPYDVKFLDTALKELLAW